MEVHVAAETHDRIQVRGPDVPRTVTFPGADSAAFVAASFVRQIWVGRQRRAKPLSIIKTEVGSEKLHVMGLF